jgi:peptidoglycan/xylan/chitin deacetylase (PgdA/CDA1 family)
MEWDYQKGNLNEPTKQYALQAASIAKERGGLIHYFCVGRVLEQPNVDWLKQIAAMGHPVGNHTYDHVNVWAKGPLQTQFRFQRSPWLVNGMTAAEIIKQNIRSTTMAMRDRLGFDPDGFRTPGGSYLALDDREDIQHLLLDEGFTWVSSKYPQHEYGTPKKPPTEQVHASIVQAAIKTQPYVYPTGLIEIPMSPISDVGAFRTSFWKLDQFLDSVRRCVHAAIERGLVIDLLMHPSIMYIEDPNFETIKMVCDIVSAAGDRAEIVGLSSIANGVRTTS